MLKTKIFVIDIDGTICFTKNGEYEGAEPIKETIEKINILYELGNRIIYNTARGSETGIDWQELTIRQLDEWGCKYDELITGKPYGDYYVDDRAINIKDFN